MADHRTGDTNVVANLSHPERAEGVAKTGHEALTTAAGGTGESNHPDPNFLGIDATIWVSLAMIVFLGIVAAKGGLKAITGGLDRGIADIKAQLDAAKELRAEAEALRDEYAKKNADAETSAAAMLAHAEEEATALIAKARADADTLVARRAKMAEDKIAAAERSAIAEIRSRAATAAATAAAALIGEKLGAAGDKPLVDRTIAGLGRPN